MGYLAWRLPVERRQTGWQTLSEALPSEEPGTDIYLF